MWAIPFPDGEILHVFISVAAARTALAGREISGNSDDLLAVPLCLVFQHRPELRPRYFRYPFGKLLVLQHAGYLQILDTDDVVVFDYFGRGLLQEVRPCVADPLMDAGDFDALLLVVFRFG